MDLLILFIPLLIWGLPISSIVWFVRSLIKFCRAPKGTEERKNKRTALILSSVTCVISLTVITLLVVIFVSAIANM